MRMDLKQKSRVKWDIDGDENTSFFHGIIYENKRKSSIMGIFVGGSWVIDTVTIKSEVFNFSNKFDELVFDRLKLISDRFKKLTLIEKGALEAPFTMEEIQNVIWCCGSEKAPGPDGYTFKFFKKYWEVLKDDFFRFVKFFEVSGSFNKGCSSSFVSLIPKVNDPISLREYRPINLIGSLYKVISKLLSLRLKLVMDIIINPEQSTYVSGRSILDGPLIMNELYSWEKMVKKKSLFFKVDFGKAFDSLNLGFLDSILTKMNFGEKWRRWIMGCLKASMASILVNGSPNLISRRELAKETLWLLSYLLSLWKVYMFLWKRLVINIILVVYLSPIMGLIYCILYTRMTLFLWVSGPR